MPIFIIYIYIYKIENEHFVGNILNKPELICLQKIKWFQLLLSNSNKLVTLVKGDSKGPFSIATTPTSREGHYSILWIAPLYSWSLLYNAEC